MGPALTEADQERCEIAAARDQAAAVDPGTLQQVDRGDGEFESAATVPAVGTVVKKQLSDQQPSMSS